MSSSILKIIKVLSLFLGMTVLTGDMLWAQFSMTNRSTTGRGSSRSTSSSLGMMGSYYTPGMSWNALVETDPETKTLIVITDDEANEHIKQIVENLDRPVPQVLIKVVFVEVTHNNDVDLGFEGSIKTRSSGNGSNFMSAFGEAAQTSGGFYHLLEKDLDLTLRALSEVGKLEVLSRPSVLTRNNQEATITVGQQVPFVRNSRVTQDGQTINTVEYDDIGIILRVTPYITSDGLVEMYLNPEISTLTGETVPISNTVDAPVFAMRSAETNVVVPNGETVVIGGLMEDNNTETVKKVPVLGDIPLLGMAFRRKTTSKTKTELLIFLTPLVVEGKAKIAKLSADEKNQMELVPEVFSNQQMKKYLDNLSEDKKVEENKPIPEANQPKTAVEKKSAARSSKRIRPFR